MIESLKEDRQLVKYAEIPQNSGSDIFKVIWKNGQNAGVSSNLRTGKVPYDESILSYSALPVFESVLFWRLTKSGGA